MAKLFAAYLAQKIHADFVPGEYDPERELWVADNQLQGIAVNPLQTINETETNSRRGTTKETWIWTGLFLDTDTSLDTTIVPDTDSGPDI